MSIRLYFNEHCPDCARQAERTGRMDWLDRVEMRIDRSPIGEVPAGEIVVIDKRSDKVFTGIFATRKLCLQIPLLFPIGLLLFLPPVLKISGRRKMGCNGDACEI